ncbi:hypothetical protein B0J18DRAFT_425995 [Chaetomium sp. MPI-SDFR-AT-0129]|nr:hypothetical protein B0J18DRAFT_425995 [Chaetomium sp. MPI-SDFR-AT-0129]
MLFRETSHQRYFSFFLFFAVVIARLSLGVLISICITVLEAGFGFVQFRVRDVFLVYEKKAHYRDLDNFKSWERKYHRERVPNWDIYTCLHIRAHANGIG